MFGLKLSVRGHQHVFQLEIPELQAFHGKIELGPEIIIMAQYISTSAATPRYVCSFVDTLDTPHTVNIYCGGVVY